MQKRGQLEISFGVIFSIIIIIATIAIAGYFIQKFISTSGCVDVQLFYSDIQKEVDSVWKSPIAQNPFTINAPRGIEAVCFGNLSIGLPTAYKDLEKYSSVSENVFLYPTKKACSGQNAYAKIEHIHPEVLVCAPVVNGKIAIVFSKESSSETFVKVSRNEQ